MAERVAGGKIGGIGLLLRELTWAPIGIFVLCEVRPNHTPSLVSLDLAMEFMFDSIASLGTVTAYSVLIRRLARRYNSFSYDGMRISRILVATRTKANFMSNG